jgi:hypothetical protein
MRLSLKSSDFVETGIAFAIQSRRIFGVWTLADLEFLIVPICRLTAMTGAIRKGLIWTC